MSCPYCFGDFDCMDDYCYYDCPYSYDCEDEYYNLYYDDYDYLF